MCVPAATQAKYSTQPKLLWVTVEVFLERHNDIHTFDLVVLNRARIHTAFHRVTEIGRIFSWNIFLVKNISKEHSCSISTTTWKLTMMKWSYDLQALIRREWNWPISCLNESETQERGPKEAEIQKISCGSPCPLIPLEACALGVCLENRSKFILDPPL